MTVCGQNTLYAYRVSVPEANLAAHESNRCATMAEDSAPDGALRKKRRREEGAAPERSEAPAAAQDPETLARVRKRVTKKLGREPTEHELEKALAKRLAKKAKKAAEAGDCSGTAPESTAVEAEPAQGSGAMCRYYGTTAGCRSGSACGYRHGGAAASGGREMFVHGNYDRYYGYRTGDGADPRMLLLRREWFASKDCLDIGCLWPSQLLCI